MRRLLSVLTSAALVGGIVIVALSVASAAGTSVHRRNWGGAGHVVPVARA